MVNRTESYKWISIFVGGFFCLVFFFGFFLLAFLMEMGEMHNISFSVVLEM